MKKFCNAALVLLFLFLFQAALKASFLQDALRGPQDVFFEGMGQAAGANGSLLHNPAGIAKTGVGYGYHHFDLSTLDSYVHAVQYQPFEYRYFQKADGLGNGIWVNALGFGYSGNGFLDWGLSYKWVKGIEQQKLIQGGSADIGMICRLTSFATLGMTAKDIYRKELEVSPSYVVGLSLEQENWGVNTDFIFLDGVNVNVGVQYKIAPSWLIQAGSHNGYITAGLGFNVSNVIVQTAYVNQDQQAPKYMGGIQLSKKDISNSKILFKRHTWAKVSLGSNLASGKPEVSYWGGSKWGTNDLITMIHMAAEDPYCEGFLIELDGFSKTLGSLALVQEIRGELQKAKKKGKKLYVFLNDFTTLPEYYLASIADKIIMPELGAISQLGVLIEMRQTKAFLKQFGLENTLLTQGKFKSVFAGGVLDAQDEQYVQELVDHLHRQVFQDIMLSRGVLAKEGKPVFDGRLITAREAKNLGFIDEFEEDFYSPSFNIEENVNPLQAFAQPQKNLFNAFFYRIAILEIDGEITQGRNTSELLSGTKTTGSQDIEKLTKEIGEDFRVKGVLIRINSQGGNGIDAYRMFNAIQKLKESGKVVYVSMGEVAASGGYFSAMNAHKIYANRATLTGSIGVVGSQFNKEKLEKWLGITYKTISSGAYMMSPSRSLSKPQEDMLIKYQEVFYQHFLSKLRESRYLEGDELVQVGQGQVILGDTAKSLLLIDELGGFYDAIEDLSKRLNMEDPYLVFYRVLPQYQLQGMKISKGEEDDK